MRVAWFIILSCCIQGLIAQPDNDHCETAIPLPADNWCSEIRAYTIFDATPSIREGQTCTGEEDSLMKDVWFEFTALGNFVFFGVTALEVPIASLPRRFTISLYRGNCRQRILDQCTLGDIDVHWIIGDDFVAGETYLARIAISVDSLNPETTVFDSLGNFGICLDSYNDSLICDDLSVTAVGDTLIELGNIARLSASTNSDSMLVSYQWYVDDSLICDMCPVVEVSPKASIIYTVLADDGMCQGQSQIEVDVLIGDDDRKVYIPNAFTPNGDSLNDRATVFGGPMLSSIKQLDIYNRWGDLVFREYNLPPNDASIGWDGTQYGKLASTGVFAYVAYVEFIDGSNRQYSGTFQLIR
ncbi:MAG: T9SS type B sorting domain-containing protein [Saprospiraceae bacterium]|nr:T9SS type B sorting domain-containing protein [Saprospiraceae bacterium]